jgi:hypothetical protein
VRLAYVTVQPLPWGQGPGRGGRCSWRPGGSDSNAVVSDKAGHIFSEHVLDESIGHLLAANTVARARSARARSAQGSGVFRSYGDLFDMYGCGQNGIVVSTDTPRDHVGL